MEGLDGVGDLSSPDVHQQLKAIARESIFIAAGSMVAEHYQEGAGFNYFSNKMGSVIGESAMVQGAIKATADRLGVTKAAKWLGGNFVSGVQALVDMAKGPEPAMAGMAGGQLAALAPKEQKGFTVKGGQIFDANGKPVDAATRAKIGSMLTSNGGDAALEDAVKASVLSESDVAAPPTAGPQLEETTDDGYVPETPEEYVAMVYAKGDTATKDEIKSAQLILENLGGEASALKYIGKDGLLQDGVDGLLGSKTTDAMKRFIQGESPGQKPPPALKSKQDYVSYVFAQGDTISVEHRDLMNRILSDAGFNPKKGDAAVRGFLTGAKSNSDNTLSLGKNSRYKADIEFAAKRTGLTKATIAALINAEAAKDKNGVWDPNSKNTRASATGLTQFISLTWEYEATNENTYLNQRAKELGYIDKSNNIVNKQGLLDLRKNSRESIVAAAEMGKRNLDNLVKAGLLDAESNEKTLAQVMYLTHQSGYTGAKRYLNKTDKANEPILTQETAKYLLAKQIGAKQANTNINIKRGNAPLAYREWLQGHMDKFVNPSKFK